MKKKSIICFLSVILLIFSHLTYAQDVSLRSLLNEMIDREALARYPAPEYSLAQFSSYDRATTEPGDSSWFANWDRSMFVRLEELNGRKEYVMFDTTGPGAVVRFWMTFSGEKSGEGILRFYLDGNEKPAIEGPAMEILSGKALIDGPLACSVSDTTRYRNRGHNLYLPIPYAKSCKITYETDNITDYGARKGEAVYYNINYRTYKHATVRSFSMAGLQEEQNTLKAVQNKLSTRARDMEHLSLTAVKIEGNIAGSKSLRIPLEEGSGAIRQVRIKLNSSNLEQALRSTIIEMNFDGERTIWCPAGDFFGTGYQIRYSNTWYTQVDNDGTLSAWWVMPFQKKASLIMHNLANTTVQVTGEVLISPWEWDSRSMHFGASWHQYTNLFTGEVKTMDASGNPFDINYVDLKGKGVYVGDGITLFNTVNRWWGEGDEKIYVDGERFPSHIGTGTEDYYGYAWCRPEKFNNHPFIAQPDGSGNFGPGFTVNLRFRGLDAIPFNKSLKFDMEMWHWSRAHINFAPVAFRYMLPGGTTNIKPDVANAKKPVVITRSDLISPLVKKRKIEGENLILKEVSGGVFRYQNLNNYGWSENAQIFWTEGKPGDKLMLQFISDKTGNFDISAQLTAARDYGKFRVKLNGVASNAIIDMYSEKITVKNIRLGKLPVKKGENLLEIELLEARPNEKKTAYFGLDYLTVN